MGYLLNIVVFVTIYATLAISLDLLAGHGKLVSLAQAVFYGIGAYATTLLGVELGLPFPVALAGGAAVSMLVSLMVGVACLGLKDEYVILATFGFHVIIWSVFNNWISLTQGPMGIPAIPPPVVLGWKIDSQIEYVAMSGLLASLTFLVVGHITRSPFGRVMHAIREDEVIAESMGKNTVRYKITAFAICATLAGLAGGVYAHYVSFIDPTSFTVMESILILSMVIIGGSGSRWGPVVGAVVLVTLPEALRFVGLPSTVSANVRQICYGSLLVALMIWRPQGIVGKYLYQGSRIES